MFQDCLSPLSMQALPAAPESLCIVEMGGTEANKETGEESSQGGLYLNIGLQVNSPELQVSGLYLERGMGGFSQKSQLAPKFWKEWRQNPPIFDKILYSIYIVCPIFSGQSPPFLRYWGGFLP